MNRDECRAALRDTAYLLRIAGELVDEAHEAAFTPVRAARFDGAGAVSGSRVLSRPVPADATAYRYWRRACYAVHNCGTAIAAVASAVNGAHTLPTSPVDAVTDAAAMTAYVDAVTALTTELVALAPVGYRLEVAEAHHAAAEAVRMHARALGRVPATLCASCGAAFPRDGRDHCPTCRCATCQAKQRAPGRRECHACRRARQRSNGGRS